MSDPDWRKILVAYINHIGNCESVDYLDPVFHGEVEGLTHAERAWLYEAAADPADNPSYAARMMERAAAERARGP